MTNAVTIDEKFVVGSAKQVHATVDVTSYTNGGESLTVSEFGVNRILGMSITSSENGYLIAWDGSRSAPTITAYEAGADGAALDEVLDTTDIGTIEVVVWGK